MEEWKKWKTLGNEHIRFDSHHSEIVDVRTGEVLKDSSIISPYQSMLSDELMQEERVKKYYRSKVIIRTDVGDAFCSTDWSKH